MDGVGILVIPGHVPVLMSLGKFAEHADWAGVLDEEEGQKVAALFTADVCQALGVSSLPSTEHDKQEIGAELLSCEDLHFPVQSTHFHLSAAWLIEGFEAQRQAVPCA